jgi:hypothetical protein
MQNSKFKSHNSKLCQMGISSVLNGNATYAIQYQVDDSLASWALLDRHHIQFMVPRLAIEGPDQSGLGQTILMRLYRYKATFLITFFKVMTIDGDRTLRFISKSVTGLFANCKIETSAPSSSLLFGSMWKLAVVGFECG